MTKRAACLLWVNDVAYSHRSSATSRYRPFCRLLIATSSPSRLPLDEAAGGGTSRSSVRAAR
eukprot:1772478-Prymnesium_polylepis.1